MAQIAHIKRASISQPPGGILCLALLPAAVALVSCGGGGGGSTPQTPPRISVSVTALAGAGGGSPQLTAATAHVNDVTNGTIVTNAAVSINGVALAYNASDTYYEGALGGISAATIAVKVTVNGVTYTASYPAFTSLPAITAPASTTWPAQETQTISWTGSLPDGTSQYAVAVQSTDGGGGVPTLAPTWLVQEQFLRPAAGQSTVTVPAGTLSPGNYALLVGITDDLPFPGGAAGSDVLLGGFTYQDVTGADAIRSITVQPQTVNVFPGKTAYLTVSAWLADGEFILVSSPNVGFSMSGSSATISASGQLTAVAPGSGTVTARYDGFVASAAVNVLTYSPSPVPPLSQAVTYQIDYAHAGRVTVGASGPTFPPTAHWSVTLGGTSISYPVIAGGTIFVISDQVPAGQSSGVTLYALNETTGANVWGPTSIPGVTRAALAYDQGTLFVTGGQGVRTFNAAAGTPGWSLDFVTTADPGVPPVAVNGLVYVRTDQYLYGLVGSTGGTVWQYEPASTELFSPAVSADGVFFASGCVVGKVDPLDGSFLWVYDTGCGDSAEGATPVYANNALYARNMADGYEGTNLNPPPATGPDRQLNAATGALLSTFSATVIPAFSDTAGFFLNSGTLSATSLSSGSTLWTFTGDGHLVSAPIVIDGTVVIASSSGMVYALDATSGSVLWSTSAGAAIAAPDEGTALLTGLGAGEGYLVVPAGNVLNAWRVVQ
jgi:outer membrane protein assembly factor BamB